MKEKVVKAPLFPGNHDKGFQEYSVSKEMYIDRCDFSEEHNANFFGLMPGKVTILRYGPSIKVVDVVKNAEGKVELVRVEVVDFVPGSKVIHWISKDRAIPAELRLYNALLSEEDVGAAEKKEEAKGSGKTWLDFQNDDALVVCNNAFVWDLQKDVKEFDKFQFERVGYFSVDKDTFKEGATKLVFNRVVVLKEATAKAKKEAPAKEEKAKGKKERPAKK